MQNILTAGWPSFPNTMSSVIINSFDLGLHIEHNIKQKTAQMRAESGQKNMIFVNGTAKHYHLLYLPPDGLLKHFGLCPAANPEAF